MAVRERAPEGPAGVGAPPEGRIERSGVEEGLVVRRGRLFGRVGHRRQGWLVRSDRCAWAWHDSTTRPARGSGLKPALRCAA